MRRVPEILMGKTWTERPRVPGRAILVLVGIALCVLLRLPGAVLGLLMLVGGSSVTILLLRMEGGTTMYPNPYNNTNLAGQALGSWLRWLVVGLYRLLRGRS